MSQVMAKGGSNKVPGHEARSAEPGWRHGQTWGMAHLFWIAPRHWLPSPVWAGAAIVLTLLAGTGLAWVALARDELA